MKRNTKDYLHLYLGQKTKWSDRSKTESQERTLTAFDVHCANAEGSHWSYTPILRPLSDMTEEENNMGFEIMAKYDPEYKEENIKCNAEMTLYLLKQGFDIFGLIEAGLAIDKTKMK